MEFLNEERKDKFISNVYKAKIDFEILAVTGPETSSQQVLSREQQKSSLTKNEQKLIKFSDIKEQRRYENELYWCGRCELLLTR